ncbi:MAG: T9SS type A sorting domain-containing protein [Endomicrobiales bacterium]|nr:T9SS type A sorting domain-containing protein [Endomicrobiales bacterium]
MKKLSLIISIIFLGAVVCFAEIIVTPNPWVPEDNKTKTGNLTDGMVFRNLPDNGEILIYTITGNLVKTIQIQGTIDTEIWNGKNDNDQYVASGVYFWIVKSHSGTKTGKLIVIR